jgi:hypothetical protein
MKRSTLLISVTSGASQSLIRYIIVIPTVYVFRAHPGRWRVFDRARTLLGLLLMGMLAALFAFDFWTA